MVVVISSVLVEGEEEEEEEEGTNNNLKMLYIEVEVVGRPYHLCRELGPNTTRLLHYG